MDDEKYAVIEKWLEHPRYHHPKKGCYVVHIGFEDHEAINNYRCETCEKSCSRGGWEWGWYGGENNRL